MADQAHVSPHICSSYDAGCHMMETEGPHQSHAAAVSSDLQKCELKADQF